MKSIPVFLYEESSSPLFPCGDLNISEKLLEGLSENDFCLKPVYTNGIVKEISMVIMPKVPAENKKSNNENSYSARKIKNAIDEIDISE